MKKMLVAFFALAASVAFAGVGIQWSFSGYGIYDNEGTLGADTGYLLDSYSMIWQLIYTETDTIEPPNPTNVDGRYVSTAPTADDKVLAERIIPQGGGAAIENKWDSSSSAWVSDEAKGTEWLVYPEQSVGNLVHSDMNWSAAGFVYQRVFQGTPALGSYYYDSSTRTFNNAWGGPPASPDVFNLPDSFKTDKVIPEPATMGLLGLGALAMVLRRKLRK